MLPAVPRPHDRSPASGKKAVVVGLARDASETIRNDVATISSALRRFEELHWLVIESDSRDDTRQILRTLEAETARFRAISLGVLQDALPKRTERIAHCRNRYLDEIERNPLYQDLDYVVVADLDGLNDSLTEAAIQSCWDRDDWDVCTANQRGPYFDVWALRHRDWSPNDCWSEYEFLLIHNPTARGTKHAAVYSRMVRIDEDSDWIEVDSAFGGFAVYRRHALSGVRYVGLDEFGRETCEHVSLHEQIRSKGHRILINPKLVNAGFTPLTRRFERWSTLKRWARSLGRLAP
jgi:hypothetical protein